MIFEAEVSGTLAGMSSTVSREDTPPEYAYRIAAREAWLEAFDKMRQSLRGVPVEAPKGAKDTEEATKPKRHRKPRQAAQGAPKVVEPEEPKEPEQPKTMDSIFFELHPEAKEYA
jgi:hypothetical protein